MTIVIRNPCDERWDAMAPRGEGRFCERCERTVVDLSRMTRARAEARVARATGRVCLALRMDARTDAPIFAPEPARAPHWLGGLVAVAALGSAGCAPTPSVARAAEAEPTVRLEAAEGSRPGPPPEGPPMEPLGAGALAGAALVTRAVPSEELDPPVAAEEPTAEQRRLTARKHAPPPSHGASTQLTYMTLGF